MHNNESAILAQKTEEQERKLLKLDGISAQSKIIEERVLFLFDGKETAACRRSQY